MARPLSAAERAFADRMRASHAKVDAAETAALRRMIDDVGALRGEVMGELARIAPGAADGWRASHLKDVQRHLDRVLGEWADAMAGNLNDGVRVAADAGHAALAAAAAGTSGAAVTKQAQQDSFAVHRRQLEQSYAYNADLVQGVASEARDAIMSRLRRGVTGQKNPVEVMRDIQKYLDVPARPTGKFGGIAYQAERVVRTEMSRMYNLSNAASMDATAEALGPDAGLQTMWLHSGVSKGARPSHVALDGTTVPYGETFDVEGYAATGPHDPSLPAEHVVNCKCTSVMTSPAWGVDVAGMAKAGRDTRAKADEERAAARRDDG